MIVQREKNMLLFSFMRKFGILYFILSNQYTQSMTLSYTLGNICTDFLGKYIFFCATFFSYLPHHPSELFYCSFTIDHMEWEAGKRKEQLNIFWVICDILNLLFMAKSTSAVGHLKVCMASHQSLMHISYLYICPCFCWSWSFVLFDSGICLI